MICATHLSTILPLIKAKPKFQFSQYCLHSLSQGDANLRLFADKIGVNFSVSVFYSHYFSIDFLIHTLINHH